MMPTGTVQPSSRLGVRSTTDCALDRRGSAARSSVATARWGPAGFRIVASSTGTGPAEAVWDTLSMLVQVTVSPDGTLSDGGTKAKLATATALPPAGGVGPVTGR